MKKFLLLFLLIPSLCFAAEPVDFSKSIAMSPAMLGLAGGKVAAAGATTYCTGATTCTATNPGNCELACEDFAGSSYCVGSSGANNCRTNDVFGIAGTSPIDNRSANISGTLNCTDKGTVAWETGVDANWETVYWGAPSFSELNTVYMQVYFNIVSYTAGANDFIFKWVIAGSSTAYWMAYFTVNTVDSVLKIGGNYKNSAGSGQATATATIETGTWYRVVLKSSNTGNGYLLVEKVSDNSSILNATWSDQYTGWTHSISNGEGLEAESTRRLTVQFKHFAFSASAPGRCNQ